ncbi:MAG: YdcF family protein [Halothece sp. Uz-M2-17]|nr:YdcF family protein [Halothece sp. Uz-M2-17]
MSKKRKALWLGLVFVLAIAGWVGYKQLRSWLVRPEAMLVLGGAEERERYAAKLAQKHPNLPIWISSGSPQWYVEQIFQQEGIPRDRVRLDYRAKDTVTNFTTLVDELKAQNIDSVYLVTSENHMRRARVIGEIVFGSRGITLKPVAVPTDSPSESWQKSLRDGCRAILWVTTGYTGASLRDPHQLLHRWNLPEVLVPEHKAERSEY